MNGGDMLRLWLTEGADDRGRRARAAQRALGKMVDTTTPYALAIAALAEAHAEAEAVYRRRLSALGNGGAPP